MGAPEIAIAAAKYPDGLRVRYIDPTGGTYVGGKVTDEPPAWYCAKPTDAERTAEEEKYARRLGYRIKHVGLDAKGVHEPFIAKRDGAGVDDAFDALSGHGFEVFSAVQRQIPFLRSSYNRLGEGMFAAAFKAGRKTQQSIVIKSRCGDKFR